MVESGGPVLSGSGGESMTAPQLLRKRGGPGARRAQAAPPVGIGPGLKVKTKRATARELGGFVLFAVDMDSLPSLAAAARPDYVVNAFGLQAEAWAQAGGRYGVLNAHIPEARIIAAAVGSRYERRAAANPEGAAGELARFVAELGRLFESAGGRAHGGE